MQQAQPSPQSSVLRVAAVQLEIRPWDSFSAFSADAVTALDCTGEGYDLVVLPQLLAMGLFAAEPGWEDHPLSDLSRIADYTEQYTQLFSTTAKRRGCWILAGTTLTHTGEGLQNAAHLFGPHGEHHVHYKRHIFPVEQEWGTIPSSRATTVFDIGKATVGIAICYESTIPEIITTLRRQGAELVMIPSYNQSAAAFHRVRTCAAAAAIQNQLFTMHVPAAGELPGKFPPAVGRASIRSPITEGFPDDGVLGRSDGGRPAVATAALDMAKLRETWSAEAPTIYNARHREHPL